MTLTVENMAKATALATSYKELPIDDVDPISPADALSQVYSLVHGDIRHSSEFLSGDFRSEEHALRIAEWHLLGMARERGYADVMSTLRYVLHDSSISTSNKWWRFVEAAIGAFQGWLPEIMNHRVASSSNSVGNLISNERGDGQRQAVIMLGHWIATRLQRLRSAVYWYENEQGAK